MCGYMSAVTAAVPPKIMPGTFAITMGQSLLLAPDTVCHPQRAVNGGDERLNPAALMAVNIADNLREVEDVHMRRFWAA